MAKWTKNGGKLVSWFIGNPKTTGYFVFLILLAISTTIIALKYRVSEENRSREMSSILNKVQQNIENSLKNSYASTLSLAMTINDRGIPENFDSIAPKLVASNKNIDAVQLVPGGIIKYVYPLKGNETVLNYDILNTKSLRRETLKAIAERKMYFAGPLHLRQGGIGVVGRFPVFINNKFWGFSAVVIRLNTLFNSVGITEVDTAKYYFQFSKRNPNTGSEEFFLPQKGDLNKQHFDYVAFSEGDWKLYLVSARRYQLFYELLPYIFLGIILSALIALLMATILKRPYELQQLSIRQANSLIQTEAKYKTIFDQAAIGIAHIDSKTGEILEINDQYCKILGYTMKEIMTKDFRTASHIDDVEPDLKLLESVKNGGIREYTIEKRCYNKDGEIIWIMKTVSPLWDKNQEPTTHISIIEDITKRKASEKAIIESQQKIESLINTIDGIVWECDAKTFEFSFISKKLEAILGYTIAEWLSTPTFWADHIYEEDKERTLNFCMQETALGRQHDFEYRMYARDGSVIWLRDIVNVIVEAEGRVILRGIMIDITQNKEAEEDLKKSFGLVQEQNKRLLNFSYIVSHNLRSHTSNIQSLSSLIETAESDRERDEMIRLLQTVSGALNETMLNLNEVINIQTNVNITMEKLNLRLYLDKTLEILADAAYSKKVSVHNNIPEHITVNFNPAYLESVLINIISNAIRYSDENKEAKIEIDTYVQENATVLRVADNGIGLDLKKNADKIFGMYKTFHKNRDAKGMGLFITKNQVDAMDGRIEWESEPGIGSVFYIYFKNN